MRQGTAFQKRKKLVIAVFFGKPLEFTVTELGTLDLAGYGLRQLGNELDQTRIFVQGGRPLHVILNILHQLIRWLVSIVQNDERLNHHTADGIGTADHRTLFDRRVFKKGGLHLKRTDPVAGALPTNQK